jgi:hypothetical protein
VRRLHSEIHRAERHDAVRRLDNDIAAVVAVADAVVDLDPLGRGFVAARAGEDTGRAGEDPHSN